MVLIVIIIWSFTLYLKNDLYSNELVVDLSHHGIFNFKFSLSSGINIINHCGSGFIQILRETSLYVFKLR